MAETVRWGILGTGGIAGKMAAALNSIPETELLAVGSRAQESADRFGEKHGIAHRHPSYEALVSDPEVQAIYVATPHNFHKENTILALEHGKAVLCEKPFAVNAGEAEQMVLKAREKRVFLMEAMWTRFLPVMARMKQIVSSGRIGELRMLQADFGFRGTADANSRWLNPQLAGGALLDVGIYPISLSHWLLGEPKKILSMAHIGDSRVDEQNAMIFGYGEGRLALLASAVRTGTAHLAVIAGTEGKITIPNFWAAESMTVQAGGEEEHIEIKHEVNGFEYQAREVIRRVLDGETESGILSLDDTLATMRILDAVRDQWDLKYPFE